ncbi:hypothetical protein F4804DRAFT_332671 [Jackrogersella minutella]|nr:hypothetical protein F4804DRAFT_332671 [Jackrogersella minutella]
MACIREKGKGPLIGTPWAGIVVTAVIVSAEVDCLAAECAALVDERLILLDAHGDGQETEKGLEMSPIWDGRYVVVCLAMKK